MNHRNELSKRLLSYSICIIQFARKLPHEVEYKIIKYQLIKSASSAGANYKEAQSGSSRADFRNKVNIALKEMSESIYWLETISIILESKTLKTELKEIMTEANVLIKILGRIMLKVKK